METVVSCDIDSIRANHLAKISVRERHATGREGPPLRVISEVEIESVRIETPSHVAHAIVAQLRRPFREANLRRSAARIELIRYGALQRIGARSAAAGGVISP